MLNRFFSTTQPVSRRQQLVTFAVLLIGALLLFATILLTSQKYADGDEAVVGMMAKHILSKGERPILYYGQVYGGGGAIEAYLAAIPFAIFGVSAIALKSVALCIWLVTIALCYLFCLRRYDYGTAIFSSVILSTATALIEWHMKMRGGYAEIPLFFILILICFTSIVENGAKKSWQFWLLGVLCGVAYYNLEIIMPFLFTLILFSLLWQSSFWRWKAVLLTVAGITIGASPLIFYNLANHFMNIRYMFFRGAGNEGSNVFVNLYNLLTVYLPRFFVSSNIGDYVSSPPIMAYVEYAIYLVLFVTLVVKIGPQVQKRIEGLFSRKAVKKTDLAADIDAFLIIYLILHILIFSISGDIGKPETALRYLYPLYPALAVVAARAVHWLWLNPKRMIQVTGTVLLGTLILLGSINHVTTLGDTSIYDDVLIDGQNITHRQTAGESISKLIAFLNKRGINRVATPYFVQWRLIFESNETIIASSYQLMPGADIPRYPSYDEIAWKQPQAFILHHEDVQLTWLLEQSGATYEQEAIGEYVVLIPK